ncbi:MAG: CHAT domain-containing protein [Pseudonocardia sp.]
MRDRLVAAVRAHVEGIYAAGTPTLVPGPEALEDARLLAELLGDQDDIEAWSVLSLFHLGRFLAPTQEGRMDDESDAVTLMARCYLGGAVNLPSPLGPMIVLQAALILAEQEVGTTGTRYLASAPDHEPTWRRIVSDIPDDDLGRAFVVAMLGRCLRALFERTGSLSALDESVAIGRQAVATLVAESRLRGQVLDDLGRTLVLRNERTRDLADLDEAITVLQAAVEADLDGLGAAQYYQDLSVALQHRFEQTDSLADLDEAVAASRAAAAATVGEQSSHTLSLAQLGNVLRLRFERRTGDLADLDEAVTSTRAAAEESAPDAPERIACLNTLVAALRHRFERIGALADLDEAIGWGRELSQQVPSDHPLRGACLANLAAALGARFSRVGALADLDDAINTGRAAAHAIPDDDRERPVLLTSTGVALMYRGERTSSRRDLDEAVEFCRASVAATPRGHSRRAQYLANLGVATLKRFELFGVSTDLDEAIISEEAALDELPSGHPDRSLFLPNLALMLLARFQRSTAPRDLDLDKAIHCCRESADLTPLDDARRAIALNNLCLALSWRFKRSRAESDRDEMVAVGARLAETTSAPSGIRVRSAWSAAKNVAPIDRDRAADLFEAAVRLLPEAASRRLGRGDQQYELGSYAGLAGEAASMVLNAGWFGWGKGARPPGDAAARGLQLLELRRVLLSQAAARALQLLELARGVLLSQALDTRSDLTELTARHPTLAKRFIQLRDQLDSPSVPQVVVDGADPVQDERNLADRQRWAVEFEATVAEIRDRDGFANFLLPPEPTRLIEHSRYGPVVVVNVSGYRCDVILVRPDGISTFPAKLIEPEVRDRFAMFQRAVVRAHDPNAGPMGRSVAQNELHEVLEWLWDAVVEPVLDALGYRHTPAAGENWPRVWWMPVGLLSSLPLHAAGYHRAPPQAGVGRRTVMDRVVSSYTPTVRALGYVRERNGAPTDNQRAVIVSMPTTPNAAPLRHATEEAKRVQAQLAGATTMLGDQPTKADVLARLGDCAIAHFACHSFSDPEDPSRSRLLLFDHAERPLTVSSLAPIRLDHARLAYLSACWTAFNPEVRLVDESVHLTTAFQLAGYPHVVGTLWEVEDAVAVRVAEEFYGALRTEDGTIDTRHSARALHHAVRAVRDELPRTPSLWAGYLHAGA